MLSDNRPSAVNFLPRQGRDEIVAGARRQRNGSVAEISRGIAIARRELGDLRSQLLM
jgi:hypothetical protein